MTTPRWKPHLLTVAFSAFVGSVVFLVAALVYAAFIPGFIPVDYEGNAVVVENGELGGQKYIIMERTRCNGSSQELSATTNVTFQHLDRPMVRFSAGGVEGNIVGVGCEQVISSYSVPLGATSGTWRVQGHDVIAGGDSVQIVLWESEPFDLTFVEQGQ